MSICSSPGAHPNVKVSTPESVKSLLAHNNSLPLPPTSGQERVGFRYVWPVKVSLRQLGSNGENTILHISPKFATVHEHVSFQWTLKMYGTQETGDDDGEENCEEEKKGAPDGEEEEEAYSSADKGYVAISLYYLDGPVSSVELKAQVRIAGEKRDSDEKQAFLEERNNVVVYRGHESELSFKDRAHLTGYIRQNIGHLVRLSLLLELDASLFRASTYLNAVSPTPYHSFLTANYRARASSKVWRKRSVKRPRSASDSLSMSCKKRHDLERAFNLLMEREREEHSCDGRSQSSRRNSHRHSATLMPAEIPEAKGEEPTADSTSPPPCSDFLCPPPVPNQRNSLTPPPAAIARSAEPHLFKKLLVVCCDSCERRASMFSMNTSGTEEEDRDREDEEEVGAGAEEAAGEEGEQKPAEEEENAFECDEENKSEMHDTLANMYFNKVVLPDMEYVEDFVDFLIDAELNDLPVLKRACERYLCGELNTKKELMTSLILDLFFIAMVFQLPVMKSMTLTELAERYSELEEVDKLLEQEEYRNIDKRIRQLCGDRNVHDLVDEVKKFREQCLRVHCVDLARKNSDRMLTSAPDTPNDQKAAADSWRQKEAKENAQQQKKSSSCSNGEESGTSAPSTPTESCGSEAMTISM